MSDVTQTLIHHQVAARIYGKFGDYHNARRLAKGEGCDDDFLIQVLRETSIAAEKAVLDRLREPTYEMVRRLNAACDTPDANMAWVFPFIATGLADALEARP